MNQIDQSQLDRAAPSVPDAAARPGDAAAEPLGFLDQVQSQLEALRGLVAQSTVRQTHLDAREAELQSRVAALEALEADVGRRSAALDARAAEQQRADDACRDALAAERQQQEQVLASRAAELRELEAELASRALGLQSREAAAAAAPDLAVVAELEQQIAALRSEAARARAERDQAMQEARSALESVRQEAAESAARIAAQQAEIEELRGRLREDPSSPLSHEAAPDRAAERADLRRLRLARYKRLLQEQSSKIVKAKAAMQRRVNEAEQVIAQRARIAEAAAALEAQKQAITTRSTRSVAAAIAAFAAVSLAVVAALAWGIAHQVAPATYAARAVLSADGKGRELTDDERSAWTVSHKALVDDPQVLAAAAENFARRDIPALGTPVAVKQRVARDLYVQSDQPGTLSFELRGPGGDRTARELETLLSAVIAVANAQRETRGDGAATEVTRQPASGSDPISSERLAYAAGMTGGGFALVVIIGLLAHRALNRAKQRFEADTAGLSALN